MKTAMLTIALAAAALSCSAEVALAQQAPPPSTDYRTNPTPAEMSQTKALNAKQAEQRGVTAGGEPATAIDAKDQEVQQKYQDELRANQEQHRLYDEQMKEYERKYGHPGNAYNAPAKS